MKVALKSSLLQAVEAQREAERLGLLVTADLLRDIVYALSELANTTGKQHDVAKGPKRLPLRQHNR